MIGWQNLMKIERILLIVLLGTVVLLSASTGVFYTRNDKGENDRRSLQATINGLSGKNEELNKKIASCEASDTQKMEKLSALTDKVNVVSKEWQEARTANEKMLIVLQEKNLDKKVLTAKVETLERDKKDLTKQLDTAHQDGARLKDQVELSLRKNEEQQERVNELIRKERVSLGTIIIKNSFK